AHMAFLGHPVVGDEKYGDSVLNSMFNAKRQILVAKKLVFNDMGELAYLNGVEFISNFNAKLPEIKQ
ncbi:MAG: RluA family pseudouridine synthase, partial [Clostridia bacterium]|nr:RluA family pseudouridine synthase [Clostridia bacterium]